METATAKERTGRLAGALCCPLDPTALGGKQANYEVLDATHRRTPACDMCGTGGGGYIAAVPKARAKTPPNSFEPCTECQRFKSRATVFTGWRMLFPERPSPIELRRKVSQELGSLRGRGGRRKELERQTGRQTAGRPTKPVDPWLADRAEASIEAWIGSHAPGVLNREHLDRNGFAALEQKHFRGTARQVARRIVAQAFGVSVRTLTRRRTAKLIDVCEEEGELRIDALERLHDPQAADVHAKITGGSEGARILTAYVDVANDEGRRLRLTIFKCPPGYSAKRGHP